MKEVIVIGAGMAGLTAAIHLQRQGYQVSIYEQQAIPGGKMHQIKDQGFTFDVGPTLVMWPEAYKGIYEAAGRDYRDYIKLRQLDPMYDVYFMGDDYERYSVSNDLTKLTAMAESLGPGNAQGLLDYMSEMYRRYEVAVKYFIRRPFRNKRDIYNPFMLRQTLKLKTFDSAKNMMAKFIPSKKLQEMMAFQTLYIGVSPENGPSLYNIIPLIELLYGVYFLEGGMHSHAQGMARLFTELGGQIHYASPVEKIIIDDGVAKGVISQGQRIFADYVISNADFPYTMVNLVQDDQARGKYTPDYIDQMDYSCSCLVFYWGVDGEYNDLETHSFMISPDLDKNLKQIFAGDLIDQPSIYLSILSNGDKGMAPTGKSAFYCLIPVPELGVAKHDYDEDTIAYYRQWALDCLEKLPGLADIRHKIELEHLFSPKDFEQAFSAYRGATFGLQPTLKQSNHWRPQSKAKNCEGLYFTGSSTHPGAGVPTAMEGGRIAADELILDDRGAANHDA
ncbi:dehydrosqualene desaturase [Aerococcus urinaehominis]|uniref:Dehydrosqualene desaturase n=1 Tax=Aerococcus urinaehominis TaxID=128944 RepID=A0A0X8FNI7_9LACT|nr:oleate hydratase [Aerococcus urinaehominis]AMB99922.1 dehydrosqualene desaturase [Aerococcus urinaehominis]SDM43331.1 phytoene desaturase [Aerococcus urinaehominis]